MLGDRGFLGYLGLGGLAAVLLFSYSSGSSYALQQRFGSDATTYALTFALNGAGIAAPRRRPDD